ncbi:MAG: sigma factor-like helix-turn-helix DNA-binding protein [Myxococcota bacterium]
MISFFSRAFGALLMLLLSFLFVGPLLFMICASLKPNAQIFEDLRSFRAFLPESVMAHDQIKRQIDKLDDEYRVPFQMYNRGFKYKEIAEKLNLPIGTIKSRIFLARKKLMLALSDYK